MRRFRIPLRARLTLVYGALFLVAGAGALTITWFLVREQFTANPVDLVGPLTFDPGTGGVPTPNPSDTPSDPAGPWSTVEQIVIEFEDLREEALVVIITQGMLAVLLVGILAGWIGWLIAGRMLRPISKITETARRIADSPDADRRMHERIGLTGPRDEVTELADTFDSMLARLDTSFDSQRRFIANASHELRTPLTLNRALIEVSTHRADASPDVQLLGETLLEINTRHERLINGLLLLARSERELSERRFVDLADVVEHVIDQQHDSCTTDPSSPSIMVETTDAPTAGDPVLLEQLVRNLLENALQHNLAEGGHVTLETGIDNAKSATLTVSNTGAVIANYELASLFEPFRRLKTERTANAQGVGLGLSIARSIVDAHQGTITLTAPQTGGLVVTVRLPIEQYGADATDRPHSEHP